MAIEWSKKFLYPSEPNLKHYENYQICNCYSIFWLSRIVRTEKGGTSDFLLR